MEITEKQMCVLDQNTTTAADRPRACQGDSGGPMLCGAGHNVLAGVCAFVYPNCNGIGPSVYMSVSEYRDWIHQHTGL